MFQSLTIRNYRLLFTGQTTKLTGMYMQFTAQDWLVLSLTHNSPYALGIVAALQYVPVLLLMLYGGKLADQYDRRGLLIAANAGSSGLSLAMGLLVVTHSVTLHCVYLMAALMGMVNAIETPVRQSFFSELVRPALLPNAIALNALTFNTAWLLGPALAGGAIALVGTGPVFLLNVAMCFGPLVMLLRMRPSEMYSEGRTERPAARIRDGLRYVWRREDLVVPMVLVFVSELLGQTGVTLPVLAKNVFGVGAAEFGLLTTALAIGGVAGALASGVRRTRPNVYVILGSVTTFGALQIAVAFGPTFWLTALLLVPSGFFSIFFIQACNQRVQLGVDAAHRGRTVASYYLVLIGTTPLGSLLTGWISERYGPRAGVWTGGALCVAAALSILAWQLRHSGDRIAVHLVPRPHIHVIEQPAACVTARAPAGA